MALFRGLLGAKRIINFSVPVTSKKTFSAPKGFLAVYVGGDQLQASSLHPIDFSPKPFRFIFVAERLSSFEAFEDV
ncbi:unnamed protein product [Brassica rapa subsp. narinosa]